MALPALRLHSGQASVEEVHHADAGYTGDVRVEVVSSTGEPIPGRTLEDCDPINGDFLDRPVTWRGEAGIPRGPDEPVSFRVRMSSAQLFAMSFG